MNPDLSFSAKAIVAGNLITILLAVLFGYGLGEMVWLYWMESVIIGIFTVFRLITTGIRSKGLLIFPVIFFACFFIVHYGMFHLVYLVFLLASPVFSISWVDILYVILGGFVLFISHGISFYSNVIVQKEKALVKNIVKTIFMIPYTRIVPMHLTIMASGFVMLTTDLRDNILLLLLFMGLKTFADVSFHKLEHKSYRKRR